MKYIAWIIMRLAGWKTNAVLPEDIKKAIILSAPHTSTKDFIWGRLSFSIKGIKPNIMIKKESFYFPLGIFLKWWGGVPVDRLNSQNAIKKITDMFAEKERMYLVITPEGTRKLTKQWKKGFYFIAVKANIPIYTGYIDYKKKETGLGMLFYPTGDYEKDIETIQDFYIQNNFTAKFPEDYYLSPMYKEQREKDKLNKQKPNSQQDLA